MLPTSAGVGDHHVDDLAATAVDKLDQALTQHGIFKQIAHSIVQKYRVEALETGRCEYGWVPANDCLEGTGSLPHQRKRHIRGGNGRMPAVSDIPVEDQEPPRPLRRGKNSRGNCSFDALPLGETIVPYRLRYGTLRHGRHSQAGHGSRLTEEHPSRHSSA